MSYFISMSAIMDAVNTTEASIQNATITPSHELSTMSDTRT